MADDNHENLIDDIASEVTKRMSSVIEGFQSELSGVAELVTDNKDRLDNLTEKVDENIKTLKRVEQLASDNRDLIEDNRDSIDDLKIGQKEIKHELKRKVDRDEFESLEKRVIKLEKKTRE